MPLVLSWLADLLVVLHLAFVLFVIFGGFLVLKQPRWAWMHLPAVAWGVCVELTGWICPLTPLENRLREQAGEAGYGSDFLTRYLLPVLYPEQLTRRVQLTLGLAVLAINLAVYGWAWQRRRSGPSTR